VNRKGDELMELIRRVHRSRVESRRILLTSADLIDERRRLHDTGRTLCHDIAGLTRDFVDLLEQRRFRQEESQS
jgi:hypothetical protein